MNHVLQAADLSVGYRRRRRGSTSVASGIELALERGQIAALLGPNGSGKSTLLRTLAGAQPALAGSVELAGTSLAEMSVPEIARRRSLVLTDRSEIGLLRARELVALGRHPHTGWTGRLSAHDHDVVDEAMCSAGVTALADRSLDRLSDGERQRVMIARALAQEPALLLLDEPTAFLDVRGRFELLELLRELADHGLGVVIATHELELALAHADLVWMLTSDGELTVTTPLQAIVDGHIAEVFGERAAALAERTVTGGSAPPVRDADVARRPDR